MPCTTSSEAAAREPRVPAVSWAAGRVAIGCVSLLACVRPVFAADPVLFQKLSEAAADHVRAGRFSASLPYYRKMVRLEPYNERALFLLAQALLFQEQPAVNAASYRRGIREAQQLLSRCVAEHTRIADRSPELGLRYLYLGLALWFDGKAERALSAFERSYRADFERLDALYNEFAVLEELGKFAEADLKRQELASLQKSATVDD